MSHWHHFCKPSCKTQKLKYLYPKIDSIHLLTISNYTAASTDSSRSSTSTSKTYAAAAGDDTASSSPSAILINTITPTSKIVGKTPQRLLHFKMVTHHTWKL